MPPIRRILLAAAYAALIMSSAWLLDRFAQQQLTAHLRDEAAHALALAARGDTPYRWRFDDAESIVAGRAFGAAQFRFAGGELVARSSGAPFDVGIVLRRPVDLALFPQLQIVASADGPVQLEVVVYQRMDAHERVLDATALLRGTDAPPIDLAANAWKEGGKAAVAPRVAAVLRLRFRMPADSSLHLRTAALLRDPHAPRLDLRLARRVIDAPVPPGDASAATPVFRLPRSRAAQNVDIDAIAQMYTTRQPLLLLPQDARVERQIDFRNAVFAALPGAILIPERGVEAAFAQARAEADGVLAPARPWLRWCLLAMYACALLWSRLRPARSVRVRAVLEAVLALAGPLWLILGERFDGRPDAMQQLLIACSLLYAVALSVPRNWRWAGSRRAWVYALAVVSLAAFAGFALHDWSEPLRPIGTAHVARYLAWALLQQYLVCAVCTARWQLAGANRALAAYLGAVGFALLHAPNAALMLATLMGGLCWCTLYLRERALLPLAVSHAASALLLLALLPRSILASAEVSARFFQ